MYEGMYLATKLPGNWIDFLHDSKNKEELFSFLSTKVAENAFPPMYVHSKIVFVTSGKSVLCKCSSYLMPDCNHEEADTSIVVLTSHALQNHKITQCTLMLLQSLLVLFMNSNTCT